MEEVPSRLPEFVFRYLLDHIIYSFSIGKREPCKWQWYVIFLDQFRFVRNYPPTLPLRQHFTLSEKSVLMLAQGRGRWAVFQKPEVNPIFNTQYY